MPELYICAFLMTFFFSLFMVIYPINLVFNLMNEFLIFLSDCFVARGTFVILDKLVYNFFFIYSA